MITIILLILLSLPLTIIILHTTIRLIRFFYKFPMPQFLANVIDNPLRRKIQPSISIKQIFSWIFLLFSGYLTVKKIKFIKKEDSYLNWSESGIGKKVVRRTVVPLITKNIF